MTVTSLGRRGEPASGGCRGEEEAASVAGMGRGQGRGRRRRRRRRRVYGRDLVFSEATGPF